MIEHPLLRSCGVRHGFGTRSDVAPTGLVRPRQVHGAAVASPQECAGGIDADAVVARGPSPPVGVVTADCVPVLAASADGRNVVAVHAGWRGLAAGVIGAGIDALRCAAPDQTLRAVIGPHIGACCYEVDAPVLDALRYLDADLDAAIDASRPGHHWLDLGALSRSALVRAGVSASEIGVVSDACTSCDAQRFHSYRRDGPRAGRLVHWIRVGILDSAGSDA